MPQRRRRTYIVGYREGCAVHRKVEGLENWVLYEGIIVPNFQTTCNIK